MKGVGTGLLGALLASCTTEEPVHQLPDPYHDHVVDEFGPAIKIDRSRIVVPPPAPPQATEYGFIMPRAGWTNTPLSNRQGVAMEGVAKITIHHSGDGKPYLGESVAEVARHLQAVQLGHLQRGMIDIAYHFAVDRTGRVWQLRWLQYEGQHVRNSANGTRNNAHNVGICMLGDFNLQAVTAPQRDRLFEMVKLIRSKYALAPAAVFMHGELVDTDCPGKLLKPVIADGRRRNAL